MNSIRSIFGLFENPRFIEYNTLKDSLDKRQFLGNGSFGTVYGIQTKEKIIEKKGDEFFEVEFENRYAIKCPSVKPLNIQDDQDIHELKKTLFEFKIVGMIQHPNVVQCLGYSFELKSEHIVRDLMFLFERGDCDLGELIENSQKREPLEMTEKLKLALDIANGIEALHNYPKYPIVHLDLKPSNIIVWGKLKAKIADFGSVKFLDPQQSKQKNTVVSYTEKYAAPQVFNNEVRRESDIYSLGCIFIDLFVGISEKKSELKKYLEKNKGPDHEKLLSLIINMTDRDYKKRPLIQVVIIELETVFYNLYPKQFDELGTSKKQKIVYELLKQSLDENIQLQNDIQLLQKPVYTPPKNNPENLFEESKNNLNVLKSQILSTKDKKTEIKGGNNQNQINQLLQEQDALSGIIVLLQNELDSYQNVLKFYHQEERTLNNLVDSLREDVDQQIKQISALQISQENSSKTKAQLLLQFQIEQLRSIEKLEKLQKTIQGLQQQIEDKEYEIQILQK